MRIKSTYRPGCSQGDQGISTQPGSHVQYKADHLNEFYEQTEYLQHAIGDCLLSPLVQKEAFDFLKWLEQASFAFNSFYYCMTSGNEGLFKRKVEKFSISKESLNNLEEVVNRWYSIPYFSASKEFQIFSTHPNLHNLNKCRIEIRSLERVFNVALGDERVQPFLKYEEVKDYQKLLNRLSSVVWLLLNREIVRFNQTTIINRLKLYFSHRIRQFLNIKKKYWIGEMPKLEIEGINK
jgi:cob(I)alamin adenosyltransferase